MEFWALVLSPSLIRLVSAETVLDWGKTSMPMKVKSWALASVLITGVLFEASWNWTRSDSLLDRCAPSMKRVIGDLADLGGF